MSVNAKVLEGYFDYKMDPKYRVSVPVVLRPDNLDESIRLQSSHEHDLPVIKVFESAVFEDKFRLIAESDLPQARKNALVGSLRMLSRQATISSQGKLTIPKEWAEKIGLKADAPVMLGGRGPYFIICTPETFQRIIEIESNFDDGGLGVL